VYRAADAPATDLSAKTVSVENVQAKLVPVKPVPIKPLAAVQKPVALAAVSPASPETEPLWTAGFDLVALGFSTMQRTASGTFHVLSAPIRRARRLL
jgi:hypothetical protein